MMRARRHLVALAALVLSATVATSATALAAGASPGHVRQVGHAAAGSPHLDLLSGVAVTSRRNAWAVGCRLTAGFNFCATTLIEHWNGQRWATMRSPSRGGFDQLASISASSARNAWAVGQYLSVGGDRTLALHWNGVTWRRVPTVNPAGQNSLSGVAVISKTDAWAVGFEFDHVSQRTLIEHWNGSRWLRVMSPSPPGNDDLNAVTAIAADNVWAVGQDVADSSAGGGGMTLVEHWDGSSWKVVPSQDPGGTGGNSFFTAVSGTSARNIWAVGVFNTDPQDNAPGQSLIERWNGSSWRVVPSPSPGNFDNGLLGVAAISPADAWAAAAFTNSRQYLRLVVHWNGAQWTATPVKFSPGPRAVALQEAGIAALSASNVWAVGLITNAPTDSITHTWIEHWNGHSWARVQSPNP